MREISIIQVIGIGDMSQDTREVETLKMSFDDALKYAKKSYKKVIRADKNNNSIYVSESYNRKKNTNSILEGLNEAFRKSSKLDNELVKFCDKYEGKWLDSRRLSWSEIYKDYKDFFKEDISTLDSDKQDYIQTYISIRLDDIGIDSEDISESKKKIMCPKCGSYDVDEWEKGVYYCNKCHYEFEEKDLKSGCIKEGSIVGNNVKVTLKDARGNLCSLDTLIEVDNKYNFGKKELLNVIKDCNRNPKDIVNALNNEKDWLVASFSTMGNGEGSESGCTLRVTDSLKNKYLLIIKY